MAVRDRLAELQHVSAGAGGVYADTVQLDPHDTSDDKIHTMFQEVERMRGWIRDLDDNTQLVRRLYSDPTYHTNRQLQEQLDRAVTQSNALGLKVCGALRQFETRVAGGGAGGGGGGTLWRIARLQYAATRRLYGDALDQHRRALDAVRDHQLLLLHQQIKLTNLAISDEECQSLLDSNNISLFVDNVRAETAAARLELRAVEARREELARVEAALREVRELFQQLAALVAAQQDQIDSVEYYALQATEHVECGGQQLLKGTVTRTKARKKKMSLLLCLAIGFLIVLLVLLLT
ncbi:syntaxin-1A [Bombyx mori]